MMRSMYSGVSGLRNHQIKMDVIGNNIANVNTVGFKKSTVVFKDALYQAYRGATSPTANCGGTNPMGVGLGMTVAAVQQMHATSSTMNTENTTDMAIDGNGYFLLKNGNQEYYTRAGSFIFDEWGNLVSNSNGYRVCGWTADKAAWNEEGYTIDTTADAEPIDISDLKTLQPVASTQVDFSGNLSSSNTTITDLASAVPPFTVASLFGATPAASSVIDDFPIGEDDYNNQVVLTSKVYDSLGNSVNVYYKFFKTNADSTGAAGTTWHCDVSLDPEFGGTVTLASAAAGAADAIPSGGVLRIADLIKFDSAGKTPTAPTIKNLTIDRSAADAATINLEVDFSSLTQFESESSAVPDEDGYSVGSLTSISVGTDGTVTGSYDNGQTRAIARVALLSFANPSGLTQAGSTLFQVSSNSGDPVKGAPNELGMGRIISNSLEMSNVDLSQEFTDMITTQRGFQANSRIITTADEMLQELVNLKR